jgi:cysteinyl-tRNA synthetase
VSEGKKSYLCSFKKKVELDCLMENKLFIYNTLTRKKEMFEPLHTPHVGMYVCGPTVYGDAHLGHARPAITFDLLFRYLTHLNYKVRYVRNITDVGHLENDADEGEDKIAKKARLEQLEPMEIVQYFTNRYHKAMEALNVLPPSIEPRASGHIIEQIDFVKKILDAGLAYESEGSVYFDVEKYNKSHHYGKLSGRNIDELLDATRELDGQQEKRRSVDFALWKKALPEHIMRWPSPWSAGFPGWHLECSVMGTKYLGETFDIHGGGMDLIFPHHECEIAQSTAALGHESVHYWMHNNMITINGQKMGKSLGNFITLEDFFTGNHPLLSQPFAPMTIRFFILQAHYRGTVDFSSDALVASEKGLARLMEGYTRLQKIQASPTSTAEIAGLRERCEAAMCDDLNTPVVIAHLFEAVKMINTIHDGNATISQVDLEELKSVMKLFVEDILGLQPQDGRDSNSSIEAYKRAIDLLLNIRLEAKANKDWPTSDRIRNQLISFGFDVKDTKDGFEWKL